MMRSVPERGSPGFAWGASLFWACIFIALAFLAFLFFRGQPWFAVYGIFLFIAFSASYLIPFPAGAYKGRREAFKRRLSLRPLTGKQCVLIACAALLLMPALSMFFEQCLRLFPGYLEYAGRAQAVFERAYGEYGFAPLFCLMVLLPSVCEEFFFRGYIASALREALPTARAGVSLFPLIVTGGLLFAIFHLDIWRFFPMLVIGMIMVWLVGRSGSIVAPITFHFVNNAMVFFIALLSSSDGNMPAEDEGVALSQVFIVFFMALLGILALMRFARNARG
jgi:membrane protease YdiL (CAAX protease family)